MAKVNGDEKSNDTGNLVYDVAKNAIQYTIKVNTNGNDATLDTMDIVDTLTASDDVIEGNYTDIKITPNDGKLTFKKNSDGKYVLHGENIAPDKSYTVTYWVPLKAGVTNCSFKNKVDANGTYGNHTTSTSASASGSLENKVTTKKTASNPVYDAKTGKTTVHYTVKVTADANNTTDVKELYLSDVFTKNADWVNSVTVTSGPDNGKKPELKTESNGNKSFNVQVGTLKAGESVTITYDADVDSSKWITKNAPSEEYIDNTVAAKSGSTKYSESNASAAFKKQFTEKSGEYDTAKQKYKFTVKFNGQIPGTNEYFNDVLKVLDDKITTTGFTYADTPAPVLQAVRGDSVIKEKTLTDANIGGKTSFSIAIPEDMRGAYSYVLTYYVNMPAGTTASSGNVSNKFTAVTEGIVPGSADPIEFNSQSTASYGDAVSNSLEKTLYNCYYDFRTDPEPSQLIPGYTPNTTVNCARFLLYVNNPIVEGALIRDKVSQNPDSVFTLGVPIEYVKSRITVKAGCQMGYFGPTGGTALTQGVDYEVVSSDGGEGFQIKFLKPMENVNQKNFITIDYSLPILPTEKGKEMAENKEGSDINGQDYLKTKNEARLEQPGMATDWVSADVALGGKIKKSADTTSMKDANDPTLICWLIKTEGADTYGSRNNHSVFSGAHDITDYIPEDQIFVKATDWTGEAVPSDKLEISADGRTVKVKNVFASEGVRIWTRINDEALIAKGINPDNFKDVEFTNKASYNAEGIEWYVDANHKMSVDRNEKTYEYSGGTENAGGVKFTLTMNKDGADLNAKGDTYTISDIMNRALSLKADTLRLNGKTIDQVPGASLKYVEGANNFELTVPDNQKWEITYYASVDVEAGDTQWLENKAEIVGRGSSVSVENTQTKKLDMTAGANATYNFFLKKYDGDNKLVSGAKFVMKEVTVKDGQLTETPVSTTSNPDGMTLDNKDGTYKIKGIDETNTDKTNKVYSIQEVDAPAGCIKDGNVRYIAFGDNISAELQSALDAKGITVTQSHTGKSFDVTNMFMMKNENTDEKTSVKVTKTWDDEGDIENIRPTKLTLKLKADGEVVKTEAVSGSGDTWTYTFKDLPKYKTYDNTVRKEITYTVDEEAVDKYTSSAVEGDAANGFTITNKHEVEKTSISGVKAWVDPNAATRPASITLGAFAGSSKTPVKTIVVMKQVGNDWAYTFNDLPKYMDNTEVKYTVREINGVDGYVSTDGKVDNGFKVTNTLADPVKYSLEGNKTLTGKDLKADQFSFKVEAANTAAEGMKMPANAKVKADGTFAFDEITFTKAGTYKFTVSEVNDGETGYTYDNKDVTVTVPVTMTEDGKLEVGKVVYEKDGQEVTGASFENTYTAPKATDVAIDGTKTLAGKDLTAGQFEFKMVAVDGNPAAVTMPANAKVKADGTFSFDKISFTKEGTYKFTVSEVNGAETGYTYDNKDVTVTVPVTLEKDNTLKVGKIAYEKDGKDANGVSFANTYTEPSAADKIIGGTKTLAGKDIKDGQFEFKMTAGKDNPAEVTLPANAKVKADGSFSFDKISFTKVGTYKFTISEVDGGETGYTYDNKDVTVTIPVTLNADNTLKVGDVSYEKDGKTAEGVSFANTYTAPKATDVAIDGTKTLAGKDITAGQFEFKMAAVDGNPAAVTMPANAKVKADGTFSFDKISFTKEGTYKFTVSEVNGGETGYTYDNKDVTVTVPVTLEKDNTLKVGKIAYEKDGKDAEGASFANTYTAPTAAQATIDGTKTLSGRDIKDGQFEFKMTADKDNPAEVTLPANAKVKADGSFSFDKISFAKEGTYKFTVSEIDGQEIGYSYDNKDVTVTIPVTLEKDNSLKVGTISYEKDGKDAEGASFANTYTAPTAAQATIDGTKTLSGKDIKDGQFEFKMTADKDNPQTVTMPANAKVKADGTFSFDKISFTKEGTYKFTVSEIDGQEIGYTYDNKDVTVTVPVTLEKDNTLKVGKIAYEKDGKDAEGASFANTYTAPKPTDVTFDGTKSLTELTVDKAIEAGQFEFKVTADKDNPAAVTLPDNAKVKEDGSFSFDKITFTKEGTYKFTVSEVNGGANGYSYDAKDVTVTVPVTLEKDNTLKVGTVSYEKDGKDAEGISFANTYEPTATELAIPVKKVIEGNDRTNGTKDFEFELSAVSATSKVAKEAPMPEETTVTINDEGTASFGKIDFKSAGTYVYQVTEKDGGAAGYTYVKEPVTVTVKVTDTDGVLSATWTTDDPESEEAVWNNAGDEEAFVTFTNKYEPKATSLALPVKKTVTGDKPKQDETFLFSMEGEENAPMPASGENTCTVKGSGATAFDEISYTKAGTYKYQVIEIPGDAMGYTYDKTVHEVVVTVVDNDGELSASWTDNEKQVESIAFVNKYDSSVFVPVDPPTPQKPTKPKKPTTPKTTTATTTTKKHVKTGDDTAYGILLALMMLSAGGGIAAVYRRRNRD